MARATRTTENRTQVRALNTPNAERRLLPASALVGNPFMDCTLSAIGERFKERREPIGSHALVPSPNRRRRGDQVANQAPV